MFKFLQPGIPIIYQGEEIGMNNDRYSLAQYDYSTNEVPIS